ncbi:efflux RND transporter periplasmic adaptor subunit [Luteimonas sp. XNQY3]|nr:efflux RND transporter periplasmic adaptor subunit [Luteimonas sp. XNQY3]MCD9008178.1 efflux RND transporter periplasmic adaptor subunit [Luteimonas sp. XNQY3]
MEQGRDKSELLKDLKIDREAAQGKEPPSRGKAPFVLVAIVVAALIAWLGFFRGQGERPVAAQMEPPRTTAAPAVDSHSVLDASGYVVARRTATVSSQVIGVVTEVLFEEGDRVEKGQILAKLDAKAASAQLHASQRQATAAEHAVRQLEVQLAQAVRESARAQELASAGLVARQDAEQASSRVDEVRAQVRTQGGNVDVYKAQAQVAQVNLDLSVIRAPFGGVITSKAAQVGEIISPSAASGYTRTGIATIVDMESLEVEVEVGEASIGRVRPDMRVQVDLNAYPDFRIPGKVIAIIPAADRGRATIKVRVGLDIEDPRIVPDMGARVSFVDEAGQSVADLGTQQVETGG